MSTGLAAFTLFHVAISLAGIVSGFVVLYGLLTSQRMDGWTLVFLSTTIATSVTGFLFPFHHFTPAMGVGILSLMILAVCLYARYSRHMTGAWRWIYVVTAMMAFYLNFFVLVVQSFMKIPALNALAPTQNEPPFKITQLVVLLAFTALTIAGVVKFRATSTPGTTPIPA
jgi:uncharacterized protein YggT (Ycf19 family)